MPQSPEPAVPPALPHLRSVPERVRPLPGSLQTPVRVMVALTLMLAPVQILDLVGASKAFGLVTDSKGLLMMAVFTGLGLLALQHSARRSGYALRVIRGPDGEPQPAVQHLGKGDDEDDDDMRRVLRPDLSEHLWMLLLLLAGKIALAFVMLGLEIATGRELPEMDVIGAGFNLGVTWWSVRLCTALLSSRPPARERTRARALRPGGAS